MFKLIRAAIFSFNMNEESKCCTKEADEVIYWILEDTIFLTVYIDMMRQYQVDNIQTHLPNDPSIHQQIVERVNESFRAIGGLYEQWHHEGKRASIETPAKK